MRRHCGSAKSAPFIPTVPVNPTIMKYEDEERDVLLVKGASKACRPPLLPSNLELESTFYRVLHSFSFFIFLLQSVISKLLECKLLLFSGGGATDSTCRSSPPTCSALLLLANKQQEPERQADSLQSPGQEGRLEAEQRVLVGPSTAPPSVLPPSSLHPPTSTTSAAL